MLNFLKFVKKYLVLLFRAIFPQPISQPIPQEEKVNLVFEKPQVATFVKKLRSFGNQEAYKKLVDAAQKNFTPMTTEMWKNLLTLVDSSVRAGSPGHDLGHSRRDLLAAFALATDKKVITYQSAEITAGIIAGALHDLATGFVYRYNDNEWIAGHAEMGAWFFFQKTEGLLEKNLRYLVAYAIAAHTHYLKAVDCKDGSKREPWFYELFEIDGNKYGWAVLACRFADRLDTNGCTLGIRHLLANADAAETPNSQDFSGTAFYDINKKTIDVIVTPRVETMETGEGKKAPTTLQHIKNFAGSNFGNSVYSQDDYMFPTMTRLMGYKVAQSTNIVLDYQPSKMEIIMVKITKKLIMRDLHDLLFRASRAPRFEESWAILEKAFAGLSDEDLAKWSYLTAYMGDSYDKLLMVFKSIITENSSEYSKPVLPLLDGLIAEIS